MAVFIISSVFIGLCHSFCSDKGSAYLTFTCFGGVSAYMFSHTRSSILERQTDSGRLTRPYQDESHTLPSDTSKEGRSCAKTYKGRTNKQKKDTNLSETVYFSHKRWPHPAPQSFQFLESASNNTKNCLRTIHNSIHSFNLWE